MTAAFTTGVAVVATEELILTGAGRVKVEADGSLAVEEVVLAGRDEKDREESIEEPIVELEDDEEKEEDELEDGMDDKPIELEKEREEEEEEKDEEG